MPKGQAPNELGVRPQRRVGNAADGRWASQPEGKASAANPLVVAFLAKAPGLDVVTRQAWRGGEAFALAKI